MGIISVIIGVCILGIGIWTAQTNKTVSTNPDVKGEVAPTLSPTLTPAPSEIPTSYPTMSPTVIVTPTKAPKIQITIQSNNSNGTSLSISKFQYPGASVSSSSNNKLELTTNDSPKTVTDWYKNTINQTGMNVKSFVTTSTNDNVVNKLVGANGNDEVRVDITRAPNDTATTIIVELK